MNNRLRDQVTHRTGEFLCSQLPGSNKDCICEASISVQIGSKPKLNAGLDCRSTFQPVNEPVGEIRVLGE